MYINIDSINDKGSIIRINYPWFHLTVIPQIRNTASVASRITSTGTTTTSLSEPCSTLKRFNITGSNFRLIFYCNIYIYIIDRIGLLDSTSYRYGFCKLCFRKYICTRMQRLWALQKWQIFYAWSEKLVYFCHIPVFHYRELLYGIICGRIRNII